MKFKNVAVHAGNGLRVGLASLALLQFSVGAPVVTAHEGQNGNQNEDRREDSTPIQHVIVLIGENRTFDHLFATYVPKNGESVKNLLSEGIINADGTAGPRFSKAAQFQAVAPFKTSYYMSLDRREKAPYSILPEPTLNFSPSPVTGEPPPFPAATPLSLLGAIEPSLEAADLPLLFTGASGATQSADRAKSGCE